jgi:transposase-like protein
MSRFGSIQIRRESKGWAYCPICTRTVEAQVIRAGKSAYVKQGQKCPRCGSSLEVASVLRDLVAA